MRMRVCISCNCFFGLYLFENLDEKGVAVVNEKEQETQETQEPEELKIYDRDDVRSPEPDWRERERYFESQRGF